MLQYRQVFFVVIVVGIQITNSRELHDLEETDKTESNAESNKNEITKLISESSSDSLEALETKQADGSKHRERKTNKREHRRFRALNSRNDNAKPKPKPKRKTIEAPYPKETQYQTGAPYPKEAPYPNYSNLPKFYSSNVQENNYRKEFVEPSSISNLQSMPLVATDIDIRRAVPFENDHLSRKYASRFRFPPATLPRPEAQELDQHVVSVPIVNFPELNVQNDGNLGSLSKFSPAEMFTPRFDYQTSPHFFQTQSFLPNVADESGLFRNPLGPTQTFEPSSPENQEPPRFVPWTPSGYEYLRELDSLDRLAPGQAPSIGFNVEVSEIAEPAFIVPENVGKVGIVIPPPSAPSRTHGLSINDAQITRNEVRKDNGEFLTRLVK